MKQFSLLSILSLIILLSFSACNDDDDPDAILPQELITTLTYTLTPLAGEPVVFSFQDLDGDGGDLPFISAGILRTNTTYNGSIELLNEQETPAGNVTAEIAREAEAHQFFFSESINGISLGYTDVDDDNNPIGLSTIITTSIEGSGTFTITLRHELDKNALGVSQGDITNAGGETDIEVTFPINVQ